MFFGFISPCQTLLGAAIQGEPKYNTKFEARMTESITCGWRHEVQCELKLPSEGNVHAEAKISNPGTV